MARPKAWHLEPVLQRLASFATPRVRLEQYATPPSLASPMLATLTEHDDLASMSVADLGAGCGMLSIAALLQGARAVVAIERDPDALKTLHANLAAVDVDEESITIIHADVLELQWELGSHTLSWHTPPPLPSHAAQRHAQRTVEASDSEPSSQEVGENETVRDGKHSVAVEGGIDVVLMNPPFGTKDHGIDMAFLVKALQMARVAVYSLHKSSTRAHVRRFALTHGARSAEVIAELKWELPPTMRFHQKKCAVIHVDFWRFGVNNAPL